MTSTIAPPLSDLVNVFDSADAPADPGALEVLRGGVADADLAAPAAALPDFHLKSDKEMPSSIAVATRDTIRPTMTCCSLNCGMALVSLDIEPPDDDHTARFYSRVKERLPYPPPYRPTVRAEEVIRFATEGARFAVERFELDPSLLERIELGGCLDTEPFGGVDRVRRELPWLVKHLARLRFATIGPSNHFIELQQVEQILDADAAALLGVEAGQMTLQYHGGPGALAGELGVLFGRRKRYTKSLKVEMAVQKPLYHLARARSWEELRRRRKLYFSGGCPPVERDGIEGDRLMLSTVMAMNYGFAFRAAVFALLTDILVDTCGVREARLVVDSPHNTIYEEQIGGQRAIVHRHNAARAYPASMMSDHPLFGQTGQPLLLPGTSRTSSYLCVAGEGARGSLYSVSHGAGSNIKNFEQRGLTQPDPEGRTTLRFGYRTNEPVRAAQLDDRGIDETLEILAGRDIARPVARMRPLAVLN